MGKSVCLLCTGLRFNPRHHIKPGMVLHTSVIPTPGRQRQEGEKLIRRIRRTILSYM